MKIYNIANAIMAYKNAILQLDSSVVCEVYENDLIFIIAIDDDKYEQFEKEINLISFEIHSRFDLEKEILCVPKDFVSEWDTPIELVYPKMDTEANMIHPKYNLNPN